jgi:hypothetical protein
LTKQVEMAKEGVMVELRCLGYSEKEIKHFQETTTCPRCGCDFSNLPFSGRWLAHLSNCEGKQTRQKPKPKNKI